MASFIGTAGDDDFVATATRDTFSFGENEGIDVIVDFDLSRDKIIYTDRSVDDFNDIEISRFFTNGNVNTVIESNDQITVLAGVDPFALTVGNFEFATGGGDDDIDDARDDVDDLPNDFPDDDVEARIVALGGGGELPEGTIEIAEGRTVTARSYFDDTTDTEMLVEIRNADGSLYRSFFAHEDSDLNEDPQLVALGNGGFALAFTNRDDDDYSDAHVYVQAYNAFGTYQGGLIIGEDDDVTVDEPSLAALPDSHFVLVYENSTVGAVYARIFDGDGSMIGSRITVSDDISTAGEPEVTSTRDGGFEVSFTAGDGSAEVLRYRADGSPVESYNPIDGDDRANRLSGTDDADRIDGMGGNDRINGQDGDDLLLGGNGSDRLRGDGGEDTLWGGDGNREALTGGDDADIFIVTADDSVTFITDFEVGEDLLVIDVAGVDTEADVRMRANADGDVVVAAGEARILVEDGEATGFGVADITVQSADDFLF